MARSEKYEDRKAYCREWAKRRYHKERAKGICTYCHKPWKGTRSYCDSCAARTLERRKDKHKRDRETRKEKGLCPRCGYALHEEADTGKIACFSCRATAALQKGYAI